MVGALRHSAAGGSRRLAATLERYGEAIEADLAFRLHDPGALGRLWRERRWRLLLNLIDHLPRDSYYVEARADDEELAGEVLDLTDALGEAAVPKARLSEFDPMVERLTDLYDRMGDLIAAVVAAAGAKPPKVQRAPRPETAAERLRKARDQRQRHETHAALVAALLPNDN